MNFLAIDTSGKYLSVIAYKNGQAERTYLPDCAMKHSVVLMDEIDKVLQRAELSPRDCDFFACCVGPGSFTGIRIGIATIKGLAFACGKPVLSVTSFDCIAYSDVAGDVLALVDAGRGNYYACCYQGGKITVEPAFVSAEALAPHIREGYAPTATEGLFEGCAVIDPGKGLLQAVLAKQSELVSAEELSALYLRKSSAEEKR